MVATALAIDAGDAAGKTAQWRQLVDLLAQAGGGLGEASRAAVLARIEALRKTVSPDQRRLAAMQLAGRTNARDAVALFGLDEPAVAAPVLATAQLSLDDWRELIPRMPAASRLLLRNRRDLPAGVIVALGSYGHSDFGLPANEALAEAGPATQIRELVARIEAFRQTHPGAARIDSINAPADHFAFETTTDGVIDWVADAPREALLGTAIAEPATAGAFGVDGQAAGAFRRRAPFRDARLSVAGQGATSGLWLISASPVFNPRDGRFAGYHGSARRPRADEIAEPVARFAGTALPVDSLRQLIHELRTPLNAILGFAEMIDQQLLGPAARSYRTRAHAIVHDGRRLLEMVEDLDQAARPHAATDAAIDARDILTAVTAALEPAHRARGVSLAVDHRDAVDVTGISASILERLMMRLIGTSLGLAGEGETIAVDLASADGTPMLSVTRPAALAGVADAKLLDPAFEADTPYPDAPLLGLGFTLRLIDSLARGAGGRFSIRREAFVLQLQSAHPRARLPADASGE